MSSLLPQKRRSETGSPARASAARFTETAARVVETAAHVVWRLRHPAARERWVESSPPAPAVRVPFETADGWRSSALYVAPCAGGRGEPVVIAHALGLAPDAYRYGARETLVSRLIAEGFGVYLTTWRGDDEAIAPAGPRRLSFDDVVERDLPAALDAIRSHAGYPRVFLLGHGFGGQVAVAHAARVAGEGIAGVIAACSPVRFDGPESAALRVARVLAYVPGSWRLPSDVLGAALAPWIDTRERLRGVLWHEADGVRIELLRQIALWAERNSIVDRTGLYDYVAATRDVRVPLLVAWAAGDPLCPEDAALALVAQWGGSASALELPEGPGHFHALFGPDADVRGYVPMARWLAARRARCHEADGELRRAV